MSCAHIFNEVSVNTGKKIKIKVHLTFVHAIEANGDEDEANVKVI